MHRRQRRHLALVYLARWPSFIWRHITKAWSPTHAVPARRAIGQDCHSHGANCARNIDHRNNGGRCWIARGRCLLHGAFNWSVMPRRGRGAVFRLCRASAITVGFDRGAPEIVNSAYSAGVIRNDAVRWCGGTGRRRAGLPSSLSETAPQQALRCAAGGPSYDGRGGHPYGHVVIPGKPAPTTASCGELRTGILCYPRGADAPPAPKSVYATSSAFPKAQKRGLHCTSWEVSRSVDAPSALIGHQNQSRLSSRKLSV